MYSANSRLRHILALLACVLTAVTGRAGEHPELAISAIPDSLRRGANAVVRSDETTMWIAAPDEVHVTRARIISLLNPEAARQRNLFSLSSSLQSIDALSALVYDASGKEIARIGRKEFVRLPLNIASQEFSDIVLRTHEVAYAGYPFTIAFAEEVTLHHTFMLPEWSPAFLESTDKVSLMAASLTVAAVKEAGLHYRCISGMPGPGKTGDSLTWRISGIPAVNPEPLTIRNQLATPSVLFAVDSCSLEAFAGRTKSWKELGAFVFNLNAGRNALTEGDKGYVQHLSEASHERRNIVRLLYKYMQQRCRYVSVQPGIGGWQTLKADFVGANQYGDCKGLSNYMMSLLGAGGITSYPVLITAGNDYVPLPGDFPSPRFNHEILCVPDGKDTIWLECTSANHEPGYLGDFTGDRDGLMITSDGGVLVHTPRLTEAQNYTRRQVAGAIADEGFCQLHLSAAHSGHQHDVLYPQVMNRSRDELIRFANRRFALSSYTVEKFHFEEAAPDGAVPAITEEIDFRAEGLVTKSATRYFINLNMVPLELPEIVAGAPRKMPFTIQNSVRIEDEFILKIEKRATPELLPKAVAIHQPFGSFSCAVSCSGDSIVVRRKYVLKAGTYAPDQFQAFAAMVAGAAASATYKAVMAVDKS